MDEVKKPMEAEVKTTTAETTTTKVEPVVATKIEGDVKKSKFPVWVIIVGVIVVIIMAACACCTLAPALGLGSLANLTSDKGFQDAIQSKLEQQIKDEAKKSGVDVNVNLNTDATKTQPLPTDFPSDLKKLIPSYFGDPYSVSKSSSDKSGSFFYISYSLKNRTSSKVADEIEATMKKEGFSVTRSSSTESDSEIIYGTKTSGNIVHGFSITLSTDGNDVKAVVVTSSSVGAATN